MAVIAVRQVFTEPTKLAQFIAPANAATKKYRIQLDLDPADLVDPTKWVELLLQQRASPADPWRDNAACIYQGGVYFKKDGFTPQDPPGFQINGSEVAGQQVRIGISPGHGASGGVIAYTAGDTINTGVLGFVI